MRIGFDFDGVLCLTPFGRLAVHAPSPVPDLPAGYEALYEQARSRARCGWQSSTCASPGGRTQPDAAAVLHELTAAHEVYIVTGRSWAGEPLVRRWLRGHGLDERIAGIRMAPPGLRPAQHKLATARILGIDAHIDDDPRTAYHLAKNGVPRVYLLDHAGAHGDAPLPPHLTLVRSLREVRGHAARGCC